MNQAPLRRERGGSFLKSGRIIFFLEGEEPLYVLSFFLVLYYYKKAVSPNGPNGWDEPPSRPPPPRGGGERGRYIFFLY